MIYIPTLHHAADLGSLSGEVKRLFEQGERRQWKKHQEEIVVWWAKVARELDSLRLDYTKVRIFQDGLPAGGELGRKIVEEVAAQGSPNYQLVLRMVRQGAALEQSENPQLLQEEYTLLSAEAATKTDAHQRQLVQEHLSRHADLLRARDRFIANRINDTLQADEVGVAFIGAAHAIFEHLSPDIDVLQIPISTPTWKSGQIDAGISTGKRKSPARRH